MKKLSISTQVEIAIAVALAIALSYWKIFAMPQGGSVSLQLIPLVILAVRRGLGPGVVGGIVFGILSSMLSPNIVHPIQAVLDYPVAFGVFGLAGVWVRSGEKLTDYIRNIVALVFICFLRYLAHFIAGVVFFSQYAGDQNVWIYSALYNFTYLAPEMIVTIVLVLLLLTRRDLFNVARN